MPFNPVIALLIGTAVVLYVRAVRTLHRRGRSVPRAQQAAWYCGIAIETVALLSPLDRLAEDLFSAHMIEHLLLADIGVPFLLFGLRSPVLFFFLPRSVLVPLARMHWLRALLRKLSNPLVAVPIYVIVLYGWHMSFAFESALRNEGLHALQHQSFLIIGALVWWSAIEPHRVVMNGALWKIGHITGTRLLGMSLGMAFVAMRTPAYASYYGSRAEAHGLTPLADQQLGGAIMVSVDILIVIFALCYFFWRAATADNAETEPVTA